MAPFFAVLSCRAPEHLGRLDMVFQYLWPVKDCMLPHMVHKNGSIFCCTFLQGLCQTCQKLFSINQGGSLFAVGGSLDYSSETKKKLKKTIGLSKENSCCLLPAAFAAFAAFAAVAAAAAAAAPAAAAAAAAVLLLLPLLLVLTPLLLAS